MIRERPIWTRLIILTSVLYLYAPLAIVAVMSFNRSSIATLPLRGFTLDWYRELIVDERFAETTIFSLRVAVASTAVATLLGTMAAFGSSRAAGRAVKAMSTVYLAPLFIPALVLAVAMASAFRLANIQLSFWTVTVGHVVIEAPMIYLIVNARLRGFDWTLVHAARTLGASPTQAFLRVLVPLIAPAVTGGAILAFAVSLDNFVVSLFLTGGDSTLPLLMWSMMREGFRPSIHAIATLFLVGTIVLATGAQLLLTRKSSPG